MSDQALFGFAKMSATEYRDDCQQIRLPLEDKPKGRPTAVNAIRLVDCPSCGGSTFDDGARPLVCHCGATIQKTRTVGEDGGTA